MRRLIALTGLLVLTACASKPAPDETPTLAVLEGTRIEVKRELIQTPEQKEVIRQYRKFLEDPNSRPLHAQAMRNLADLEMKRIEAAYLARIRRLESGRKGAVGKTIQPANYEPAIRLYTKLLHVYPDSPGNDRVWYQLAKAYEQSGQRKQALAALSQLSSRYPQNNFQDEVAFRRGELLFQDRSFRLAEKAYAEVLKHGDQSVYYEKALYKHGWSRYKRSRYKAALKSYFALLDRKLKHGSADSAAIPAKLTRGDRELVDDTFRVVALSFSRLSGPKSIDRYFAKGNEPVYLSRLYTDLGRLYLKQERYVDAGETYQAFIDRHPAHPEAPGFQLLTMKAYEDGGFKKLILQAKEDYVDRYGVHSVYWKQRNPAERDALRPMLKKHTIELAKHYHAVAQSDHSEKSYRQAGRWYERYLNDYRDKGERTASINFLYAESLYESGQYQKAGRQYEHTAYDYGRHKKGGEAAYSALLAYRKQAQSSRGLKRMLAERQATDAAIRLAKTYPHHPRRVTVLTNTAERLFRQRDGKKASELARQVIDTKPRAAASHRRTSWTIIALVAFDNKDYEQAEKAYVSALNLSNSKDAQTPKLRERLAASVYKQGEVLLARGDALGAIGKFSQTARIAPNKEMRATADYDIATAYINLKKWPQAIASLQHFRNTYPAHTLQQQIPGKLAVAYTENRQWSLAGREYENIARHEGRTDNGRDALWQAAALYEKAGRKQSALHAYQRYVEVYPRPLGPAIEAHQSIAALYRSLGNKKSHRRWLQKTVKAEQSGGRERSVRTKTLAARAMFALAEPMYAEFRQIRLVRPLKKSLVKKKRKMKAALKAYAAAADYGISDVTTASTYRIAEMYHDLGRDLLKSERPRGLSSEERVQYDLLLEEQAFPFEEKAIKLHEANRARASDGIYDSWVKKSFTQLGRLSPVRYGKSERSERVIRAID
jgi:tetratricopeptide (TPR) repeat protein